MTTETKDRIAESTDNPLGLAYERPHQKIIRLSKIQQIYRHSPKLAIVAGFVLALAISASTARILTPAATPVVEKQESLPIDTDSILAGSESNLYNLKSQSVAQLETYREQLLSAKAERFLMEAQKQIDDKNGDCFMQSVTCPLNRFQAEAVSQLETARADGDYDALLRAADRALIVEYARASQTFNSEPEHALTQVAISNLVTAHKQHTAASAEAKAQELKSAQ